MDEYCMTFFVCSDNLNNHSFIPTDSQAFQVLISYDTISDHNGKTQGHFN